MGYAPSSGQFDIKQFHFQFISLQMILNHYHLHCQYQQASVENENWGKKHIVSVSLLSVFPGPALLGDCFWLLIDAINVIDWTESSIKSEFSSQSKLCTVWLMYGDQLCDIGHVLESWIKPQDFWVLKEGWGLFRETIDHGENEG